jgi:AraC-like DNA-binding protein
MSDKKIYVSELGSSKHIFNKYHFCRGNTNKRKTRIGLILKGSGTYIYLNKKLKVKENDVVFIPENIYCYSEWHGQPEIEVVYLSCFIHYDSFRYEPQIINAENELKKSILTIASFMNGDQLDELEGYSLFYRLLRDLLPRMAQSDITYDNALQTAIEYITANWKESFSVATLAKKCCVSESTLYHLFQNELGQSPVRFLNSIRINVALEYLENSNYSIATISQLVGFNSENHFRKVFSEFTGTTPLKFKKRR